LDVDKVAQGDRSLMAVGGLVDGGEEDCRASPIIVGLLGGAGGSLEEERVVVEEGGGGEEDVEYKGTVVDVVGGGEAWSAIRSACPFAATGPNNVPNIVLQDCWPALWTRLVPLYAAVPCTGFSSWAWRVATAVVLQKPIKEDYLDLKADRLIAAERCIAKGVNSSNFVVGVALNSAKVFPSVQVNRLIEDLLSPSSALQLALLLRIWLD
ncbi:hypothetical protein JCM11251_004313, partial [Rhodosporidiobolus azoricus]